MRCAWLPSTMLLAMVAGSACSTGSQSDAVTPADSTNAIELRPGRHNGIVTRREGNLTFVPCGSVDTIPFIPQGQFRAVLDLVKPDSLGVFAMVGFAGSEAGNDTVYYATKDRFECATDWSGFDFRATGAKPGWVAEVRGSRLYLREQGGKETVLEVARPDVSAVLSQFLTPDGGGLTIELEQGPCRNSATGALSALSARLTIDGRTLRGCAVPGISR